MKTSVGLALAIAFIAGCNGDTGTGPDNSAEVGQYLQGLPSWTEFSPPLADQDPSPTGAAPTLAFDTVGSVTRIDSLGNTTTDSAVPYICSETPYSVQKTPQQIVMYSPNQAILYPGAFIQGKSYRDGIGSMLPLSITKRAPINVSIPAIQSADNFRTVDLVDQAHVASAVGGIIGSAVANNLQASSSMYWHMESYNSQSQFALSFNASGHYLGFEASVGGSIQTAASENTVTAHFYQKMFTVVVSPPPTPAGWFRDDFTAADLQQQVQAGNIGPDNLPVFIGEIVYGRMMMFSVTSTASMSDIQASISASYSGLIGGGSASLSAQQKKILQTAKIEMTSVGGNDSATIAMIRSGDWSQYFTVTAPLSTAEPLSYTFYNLATNTIAQVTEATSYNVKACAPATAGQFDFLPAQTFAAPVPTPFEVKLADVNGDARPDLIFNHRGAGSNNLAVALSEAGGTFAAPTAMVSHPATPSAGWAAYDLNTGDFNGDGRTDLLWSVRDSVNNIYVALADGAGGWTFEPMQQESRRGWTGYSVIVGDINGDGSSDLVFNLLVNGANYLYTALSNSDGTFALDTTLQVVHTGGWSGYYPFLADINRDGRADLIWNTTVGNGTGNTTYSAFSLGTGRFGALMGAFNHPVPCCWQAYRMQVSDVNRDQIPDMIWYAGVTGEPNDLYVGLGTTAGPLIFPVGQHPSDIVGPTPSVALLGDVDGDGGADVIIYGLTAATNTIAVLRGTTTGYMDPAVSPVQIHPVATNWNAALPAMSGDVNADGRADVVWVIPGSPTRLFVALSRAS